MARKQPTADEFLADLDAKGITYTVKAASSLDWSDLAGPARQKTGKRINVVPDLELAKRIAERGEPCDVFEVVPIKTVNPCNSGKGRSRHWWDGSKRANAEIEAVKLVLNDYRDKLALLASGCVVTLTRLSPGRLNPDDGLRPALKHVRDAIGQLLFGGTIGQNDEDPRAKWLYEQRRVGKGVFGVIVSIKKKTS